MLNGRIQEVEMLTNTKASQAELEVIKNNKVGVEELRHIENQIQDIRSQILNLEGEEKEEEPDSDGLSPISNSTKYKRYIKNVHGYGEEIYKLIDEDQKSGSSIGIKKHLRYHQLQLNEIWDKILYDDNRFENMRNEILMQREQLSQFSKENQCNFNVFMCFSFKREGWPGGWSYEAGGGHIEDNSTFQDSNRKR